MRPKTPRFWPEMIAHAFVGQSVNMLEKKKPDHKLCRNSRRRPLATRSSKLSPMTLAAPAVRSIAAPRERLATYLYRAAASHVRSFLTHSSPEKSAVELFGRDEVTALVLRGATTQATTGSPSWAQASG
jgi:hypothetical protein